MDDALLLNSSFMPLRIVSWKKAIILMMLRKVEVIEESDWEIHSVSLSVRVPSVIRLLKFVGPRNHEIRFTRYNIYLRDQGRCQYCGRRFRRGDLTYDHVTPRARGGTVSWENIVTCCRSCNLKKGGRTPEEANMHLIRPPQKPDWLPPIDVATGLHRVPTSWQSYLPANRLLSLSSYVESYDD